jgi:hypothetical protein
MWKNSVVEKPSLDIDRRAAGLAVTAGGDGHTEHNERHQRQAVRDVEAAVHEDAQAGQAGQCRAADIGAAQRQIGTDAAEAQRHGKAADDGDEGDGRVKGAEGRKSKHGETFRGREPGTRGARRLGIQRRRSVRPSR